MQPVQKIRLVFYRSRVGAEPVRDWLRSLPSDQRRAIGLDLSRIQYRWPVGMPLCRPLGQGLWETRTDLPGGTTARVFFCHHAGEIWALHGIIKKTRATPADELKLARKRLKEVIK